MTTVVGPELNPGDEFRMNMARLSDAEQARQVELRHLSSAAPSDEELAEKVPDLGIAIVDLVQLVHGVKLFSVPLDGPETHDELELQHAAAPVIDWLQLFHGAGIVNVVVPEPEADLEDETHFSLGNELDVSTGLIAILGLYHSTDD